MATGYIVTVFAQTPQENKAAQPQAAPVAQQAAAGPMAGQPFAAGQFPVGQGMPYGSMPGQPAAVTPAEPAGPAAAASAGSETYEGASGTLSEEEIEAAVKVDKNKERISLDLKGIDILELFKILSIKMGVTIVPTKSVSGRVNIFLNNLTFADALDVILISQDLACEKKGKVINIMTSGEYERLYGQRYNERREYMVLKVTYAKPASIFNALSQVKSDIGKIFADETSGTIILVDVPEKLALMEATAKDLDRPPQTEIFDIKYAKSADMKTHLTSAITTGPGEVLVDERTNKVVVSDLPEKMKKIKKIVRAFDEETKEVFIEAEILQITLKDEYQRGISWEKIFSTRKMDGLDIKGTFPVAPSWTPSPLLTADYLTMTVGTLAVDKYTAAVQFLETFGDAKVLSRPRIAAINNQEARILVGSREAYVTQSQSQATSTTVTSESVNFIDVGVKLNVVPAINEDGFVTMKIKPEVSSVREVLTTGLGSKIPIVETSEAETTVKVKDGTMIMIAGLMKDDKREDVTGMPFLSQVPFIGALFRARAHLTKKTEIIVFLTPHIITGDARLPGTGPEDMMNPDIVPRDIEQKIVSEKIDKIKVRPPEPVPDIFKDVQRPKQTFKLKDEERQAQIGEKIKGIKEY
jgi:MSHA type pilus biogenesis protein MshL